MKKFVILILLGVFLQAPMTRHLSLLHAQPNYDFSRLKCEKLNRGVVAFRSEGKVIVSWRILTTDAVSQPFDIYRNGIKLNKRPIKRGGSFFIDNGPIPIEATYEVRGGGINGSYTLMPDAPEGYLPVTLQKPADGMTPDGQTYTYSANDASVGDVDCSRQCPRRFHGPHPLRLLHT